MMVIFLSDELTCAYHGALQLAPAAIHILRHNTSREGTVITDCILPSRSRLFNWTATPRGRRFGLMDDSKKVSFDDQPHK